MRKRRTSINPLTLLIIEDNQSYKAAEIKSAVRRK